MTRYCSLSQLLRISDIFILSVPFLSALCLGCTGPIFVACYYCYCCYFDSQCNSQSKRKIIAAIIIMGRSFLEGGPIMYWCCPSVPCLHLEKKWKGLQIPDLVGRILRTRAPRGPISRSKVKVTAGNCVVGEKFTTTKARSPCSVVKSKWFTRWQHLLSPCGSTHVGLLNCKDGPIAGRPSTAAHSCFVVVQGVKNQYAKGRC